MTFEELTQKATRAGGTLQKEVREKTTGYILAAFGFVAGLAWNDAIKALIEEVFPANQGNLTAKFVYAFGVTLILVFVTIYFTRVLKREE